MTNTRSQRKTEHLHLSLASYQPAPSYFKHIHLVHQALPKGDFQDIDLSSRLWGKRLPVPILIDAMTGGTKETKEINHFLARLAQEFGLSMAVGSQTIALEDTSLADTFAVTREVNPQGLLIANVGASAQPHQAEQAIRMIQADALQIHLNLAQELAMPEGDREFVHWTNQIQQLVQTCSVPVIAKEIGFGLSKEVVGQLMQIGVLNFDVGGSGGTNFLDIEKSRYQIKPEPFNNNWGIPTICSLMETVQLQPGGIIIATGGVRTPLDVVKCLALGASLVGMAQPFLQLTQKSYQEAQTWIKNFISEVRKLTLLSGALNLADLKKCPIIFSGFVQQWIEQRQLHIYRDEG